jgi:hypothetical protein
MKSHQWNVSHKFRNTEVYDVTAIYLTHRSTIPIMETLTVVYTIFGILCSHFTFPGVLKRRGYIRKPALKVTLLVLDIGYKPVQLIYGPVWCSVKIVLATAVQPLKIRGFGAILQY